MRKIIKIQQNCSRIQSFMPNRFAYSGRTFFFGAALVLSLMGACGDETKSSSGGGSGGSGGSGGQMACVPGSTTACYTGPLASINVGPCKEGLRTCNAEGTGYGVCEGQVTPLMDDCATPEDEDCDGTPAPACAGTLLYGKRLGGTGEDVGRGVAFDGEDALLATGSFESSVDFGSGSLMSAGGKDIYVAKWLASGDPAWSKAFGGMGNSEGLAITSDVSDNLFVTGWFDGSIDVGAGSVSSAGGKDIFVLKLNSMGATQWGKVFSGAGTWQEGVSAAADKDGNLIVVGHFDGMLDVGGTALTSAGGRDIFAAKLDGQNGNVLWAKSFGDVSEQFVRRVAVNAAGDIWFGGGFSGSVDFGGGPLASSNGEDAYLVKLDGQGAYMKAMRFGEGLDQALMNLAVVPSGGVVVSGRFKGGIDLGGGILNSMGGDDIFLAKLDEMGAHQWSMRFGDANPQVVETIAVDFAGNISLAGRFLGSLDLGHKPPLPGTDADDVFVARLDPMGAYIWAHAFGGTFDQIGTAVAVDSKGNTALTGLFLGSIDLGGGPLLSAGLRDSYVAVFTP